MLPREGRQLVRSRDVVSHNAESQRHPPVILALKPAHCDSTGRGVTYMDIEVTVQTPNPRNKFWASRSPPAEMYVPLLETS